MKKEEFTTGGRMIDRMAIIIVDGSQTRALLDALRDAGFRATIIDAVGGFFHEAMVTLIVGLPQQQVERFLHLVEEWCPRRRRYISLRAGNVFAPTAPMMMEVSVGGATVFILPVERFVQIG